MTSWQRMASAPEKPAESFLMPPLQTGEELLSALERLGYAPRPLRRLVSTYTYRDTRDGALRAAGLELRLHAEGARWQLLDRGMVSAQRKAADSTDDVPGAGRLGLRLRALAGGRPLLSQLSAACTETVHLLSGPSSRPMSLSVQEWEFSDLPERNHRVRCRVARIVSSRGARVDIDYLAALLHRHLSLVPTRTGIFDRSRPSGGTAAGRRGARDVSTEPARHARHLRGEAPFRPGMGHAGEHRGHPSRPRHRVPP